MINRGTSNQSHHLLYKADQDVPACLQACEAGAVTMSIQQMERRDGTPSPVVTGVA